MHGCSHMVTSEVNKLNKLTVAFYGVFFFFFASAQNKLIFWHAASI